MREQQCSVDNDLVVLEMGLVMPEDRAVALLTDFRDKRMAGEPATIAVNVMHVAMVATSGEMPAPVEGQQRRMRHVKLSRPRGGISRLHGMVFLVVLVAIAVTTPFATRLTLMVELWMWLALLGFRVGQLMCRR